MLWVLVYPPSKGAVLISFTSSQETEAALVGYFFSWTRCTPQSERACLEPSYVLPKGTSGKSTWTPAARVCRDLATRKPGACWGADEPAALWKHSAAWVIGAAARDPSRDAADEPTKVPKRQRGNFQHLPGTQDAILRQCQSKGEKSLVHSLPPCSPGHT